MYLLDYLHKLHFNTRLFTTHFIFWFQKSHAWTSKGSFIRRRYCEDIQHQVIPALQEKQCLQTTVFIQDRETFYRGQQIKKSLRANFREDREYGDIYRIFGQLVRRFPLLVISVCGNSCTYGLGLFMNYKPALNAPLPKSLDAFLGALTDTNERFLGFNKIYCLWRFFYHF